MRPRTKHKGLHELQCVWCIWCVLVLVCVNKCASVGRSFLADAVIYPPGPIMIPYDSDLEIFCVAMNNCTAEDLSFSLMGNPLQSEIINVTTIRLLIEKAKHKGRTTYYCRNNRSNTMAIEHVIRVMKPTITDFKCISKNFDILNCSWVTDDGTAETNYSLAFTIYRHKLKACVANYDYFDYSPIRYCYWNTTSKPRYRQQEEKFVITVRGENCCYSVEQEFVIDHYSIVKPDPPIHLTIGSITPHSVFLKWELPTNIRYFMPNNGIEPKIEYNKVGIDNISYFQQVNVSQLPLEKNPYKYFNLTDLPYAHMKYVVRVYIKPVTASNEFWSDFSNIEIYTASEIPQNPPETIVGAFDQSVFEGRRLLCIYWKQLKEYEEAGTNFTYKIEVTQDSGYKTYEPDRSKSLGFLSLTHTGVESLQAMDVRIRSFNEMGPSTNSSYLYIPGVEETESLSLSHFTKFSYENGTYELSWVPTRYDIDNYTLFWCQDNTTNICIDHINFTFIEPSENEHIIHLPKNYRYQFAISVNKGLKSSGMIWVKCDISMYGISKSDSNFLHFMNKDAPGKTFVTLKWSRDCTFKGGISNGYVISYCPVIGISTICNNSLGALRKSYYIVNDSEQTEVTIDNLRPYTTYQFTLALNTSFGLKALENATVTITTPEDAPTKPRNVTILDVQSDSMVITWDPPLRLNGHIKSVGYFIQYNQENLRVKYKDSEIPISVKLDGLTAFTNYIITLKACNEVINSCSDETSPVIVRTKIRAPNKQIATTTQVYPDDLNVAVRILPPRDMSLEEGNYIKDTFLELLMKNQSTQVPVFRGFPSVDDGVLKIWCEDIIALSWVQFVVPEVAWKIQTEILIVVNQSELPPRAHAAPRRLQKLVVLRSHNPWYRYNITKWNLKRAPDFKQKKRRATYLTLHLLPEDDENHELITSDRINNN